MVQTAGTPEAPKKRLTYEETLALAKDGQLTDLLTLKELMVILDTQYSRVHGLVSSGAIKHSRPGNEYHVKRSDLITFIETEYPKRTRRGKSQGSRVRGQRSIRVRSTSQALP
jgi:hypothetical protein